MRVLWFVSDPLPALTAQPMQGAGWLDSLSQALKENCPEIEVGIASPSSMNYKKVALDGITYFNIPDFAPPGRLQRIRNRWLHPTNDAQIVSTSLGVVEDFKPDLIHIHGTEAGWGLIGPLVRPPVLISIQGILTVIQRYFLKGLRWQEFVNFKYGAEFLKGRGLWHEYALMKKKALREKKIIESNHYFVGRTDWDQAVLSMMNPAAAYIHGGEILNRIFYQQKWLAEEADSNLIFCCSGGQPYKGLQGLLEALALLKKDHPALKLRIAGSYPGSQFEAIVKNRIRRLGLEQDVFLLGRIPPAQMAVELKTCGVYAHPSYIDNSPNNLCEAMLMGVPCAASYTGGIPSLVKDGFDGLLFNADDPYDMAAKIKRLMADRPLRFQLSANATARAAARHDPAVIARQTSDTYRQVLAKSSPPPLQEF